MDTEARTIAAALERMQQRLDTMPPGLAHRRQFLETYQRTTIAVGKALADAGFEDPEWVEAWDVRFAEKFLDAHDADIDGRAADVSRPWRLAFAAPPELPPIRHLLLGMNAHINYDLPQALLAVISDEQFGDEVLLDRRRRDHERIDAILVSRVAAEDNEVKRASALGLLDRVITPLNRASSRHFLPEARRKVWHNTVELHQARVAGPDAYRSRLAELEVLSAARIADLLAPGQVILRLAVSGFGVALPPL